MVKLREKQIAPDVTNITDTDSPYQLSIGEYCLADSTAGPITMNVPVSPLAAGDRFWVKKTNEVSPDLVFVEGNGVSVESTIPGRGLVTRTILLTIGEALCYIFDGTNWRLEISTLSSSYLETWTGTPLVAIPSGGQTIQWTFVPVFTGQVPILFNYAAGIFTALDDFPISIQLNCLWEFVMTGNNQDALGFLDAIPTGTGTLAFIQIVNSFAHTRTGNFFTSNASNGRWSPAIGDTMKFDVNSDPLQSGQTDLPEVTVFFSVE